MAVFAARRLREAAQRLRKARFLLGAGSYSRLFLADDGAGWSLTWDALHMKDIADALGIRAMFAPPGNTTGQSVFHFSKYDVLGRPEQSLVQGRRAAFPYYHGYPDSVCRKTREFWPLLGKLHPRIDRIQVTHAKMEALLLHELRVPAEKVKRIPIGIDLSLFRPQTPASRRAARERFGAPQSAVVVGSFQKDGEGWGEGDEPKLIKGPDVFLEAVRILKARVPELFVLLTGPSRGYVKRGLAQLGAPFAHCNLADYRELGLAYQALDLYIVASREEGGPKAVFESMASGVPLATTRVGQAMDVVEHGANAFLVDVEDAEGLAHWAEVALCDGAVRARLVENGFATARANAYSAQLALWRDFFEGFVETSQP